MEKKNKLKGIDIILIIISVIFFIFSILFYLAIIKSNLLSIKYINVITITEIIFTILIIIGLAKKHKTYKLNVICLIIAVILSTIYVIGINYINATTQFIGKAFTKIEETNEYYIVVKKDSNIKNIQDLEGKEVYNFNGEKEIEEKISNKVKINYKTTNSLTELGKNILSDSQKAILISASQYDMLDDEIKDFKNNTKIIYKLLDEIQETAEEIDKNKDKDKGNKNNNYQIEDSKFNVYISGIDTSGRITNVSRSDANIIASINTKTHEILLTSIPRDYYVTLHSKGVKDKLTHSGIYGINETISTVEDLLGIDINYYVRVNFNTVEKVVDTLGGVDVHSDYTFNAGGYHYEKGINHLNGKQALAFSRERHSFNSGDNQRIKDQQYVINAIINKALSTKILTKYTSILNSLEGTFQTNINQDEINKLVQMQLDEMPSWNIINNSLTGSGDHRSTYSMGKQKLYVMIPNEASIISAKEKINNILK